MKEILREIFEPRLKNRMEELQAFTPEEIERITRSFITYLEGGFKDIALLSELDLKNLDARTLSKRMDVLKNSDWLEWEFFRYMEFRKKIEDEYRESESWGKVFSTHVYEYSEDAQEAFIDAVEAKYQTKIKDAEHLSRLTGITELYNYWDKEKGFLDDEEAEALAKKTKRPLNSLKATPKQSREEALRQLNETLIASRSAKYHRALKVAIEKGANYNELLNIEPNNYGLTTEPWQSWGANTKQGSILLIIAEKFLLHLPGGLMVRPSLRAIAEELEAPYSIVMEAYKWLRN